VRIAIVAPYDLSAAGGINNQIRAQARALRRNGHDVVVAGAASGDLAEGEVSLGRTVRVTFGGTDSGLGVDPRGVAAVRRLMRQPFDVVHVHEPLVPLVPWIVLRQSRVPLVATFHVHREHGHRFYAAWRWVLTPLVRRLAARIAVSEAARRTVAEQFPGEYEIVPNGIEGDRFRTRQPRPAIFASGRRHVVYIGRLEPRKGVDHLIRAMPVVQRVIADIALVIVGDGSSREALAELARDAGATVHFTGHIDDDELPAYFQAADIFCAPALGGESFGIVLLEAMACGTPVVASRIEGYEALAGAAGAAALVPPGDAGALAAAVTRLLGSAAERRALADAGSALARDHDWETLAPRLETIYRRVIA